MIHTIIIEDEELAAIRLQKIIQEINKDIVITKLLSSVKESISYLSQNEADLIFMDINLSDGYAFEIFESISIKTPIIFTTAYSEYAIKAFEQNSIDYLVKPIDKKELKKSIDKYINLKDWQTPNYKALHVGNYTQAKKRFLVKINKQLIIIPVEDIAFFYTEDKLSFIRQWNGKSFPIDYSLKKIEEIVDPNLFFRISRKYIVHLDSIQQLYYTSKSRIKLKLKPASLNDDAIVAIEKLGSFKKWLSL
ncbi:MAG: response regulator transcription factor [Labilibaculum sp.]|nr:response regulator transcription factor [Labilibaculum sp.]